MKINLLLYVLIILTISCKKADAFADGTNIFFESPQPANDSELDHFPAKYRGLYMSIDSTYLRINENVAQYEYYNKYMIHKKLLDTLKQDCDLIGGKLINKELNMEYDVFPKGDSLLLTEKKIDTIFRFSYYQKAKRVNGNLILSEKDSIFWRIKILSIEKNHLKLKIIGFEDIHKMDSLTIIKSKMLDSSSYLLNPSRKEFKNILNIKQLGYLQEFKRVKN